MPVICACIAIARSRVVAARIVAPVVLLCSMSAMAFGVAAVDLPYIQAEVSPDASAVAVAPPPGSPATIMPVETLTPAPPVPEMPTAVAVSSATAVFENTFASPSPSPEMPTAAVDSRPTATAIAMLAHPPLPTQPIPETPTDAAVASMPLPDESPVPPVQVGVPKHIRIPSAGINANIEVVGLERDGSVGTPKNYDNTGWYEPGPRPGEPGNAVIVGHVDSAVLKRGAVFWNLRNVKPGDDITVTSDDGAEHHFTVTGQQQYTPQNVPIDRIFGQADGVHLNLVTCDATTPFNRRTGEYGGWLLVTADATP